MKNISRIFILAVVFCLLFAGCKKEAGEAYEAGVREIDAGNYYAAIDIFSTVIDDEGESEKAKINALLYTAEANIMLDQNDEAIAAYKAALEYDEKNTKLLITLGNVLQKSGKTEDALEFYERAVSYGDDEALLYVGAAYIETECYEEAESVLLRYAEKDPLDAGTNYYLSKCSYELGNTEAAVIYAENAIQLGDTAYNDMLLYHLAVLYEDMNQWDKALQYMGAYVNMYPDDEKARTEYTFISTRVQ